MEIPEVVRRLLWEYDTADPEVLERVERVLLERVMARGDWDAMRWLLGSFSSERLRAFLEGRGRRVLPPRELRFWSWVCGVDDDEAASWVGQAREREAAWRG